MKKIFLSILLFSYIFIGVYAAKSEALYDSFVRLHILANSNSAFDQAVKIKVRNNLLKTFQNDFKSFKTKEETLEFMNKNKEKIAKHIDKFLKENNIDYSSQIAIEKTKFDKSSFNNINLPIGNYDTVKIFLGRGKGKNLFFVLFPALSIQENVTVKTGKTNETKYKSKIWELFTHTKNP